VIYRFLLRPLLFLLPAETAHRLGMSVLRVLSGSPLGCALLRAIFGAPDPVLRTQALGLSLASPIGLAAGLDKDAEAHAAFAALGFGFVEVGTLTAEPQPGNPQPRLFRLPVDRALVNRMGFNNHGAADAARRLAASGPRAAVLGINIGKSKVVPSEHAVDDYVRSAQLLAPHADYLVVNVSSPNTPGLRDLQAVEKLQPLLAAVRREALVVTDRHVPLLVKIAPDLSDDDVLAVADLVVADRLDGIVATNTTISRDGLHSTAAEVERAGAGGLSGAPLLHRSLEVLRMLRSRMGEEPTLIGVGGIATFGDAVERLAAGADLLQAYTALIYQGPTWPGRMNRALARRTEPALSGKDAR